MSSMHAEHKAFHDVVLAHSAYAQYGIGFIEIHMKINLPKRQHAAERHKSQSPLRTAPLQHPIHFAYPFPPTYFPSHYDCFSFSRT